MKSYSLYYYTGNNFKFSDNRQCHHYSDFSNLSTAISKAKSIRKNNSVVNRYGEIMTNNVTGVLVLKYRTTNEYAEIEYIDLDINMIGEDAYDIIFNWEAS